jgi:hypothetical protein
MVYAPGTLETDQKKQNMALQQQASAITTVQAKMASISTDNAAARFDGTGGVIQNSPLVVADTTGALSRSGNGGIPVQGTNTNDSAPAGYVGEYVSSVVLAGSAVSLTTATAADITSISLTAGDWDVSGAIFQQPAGATVVTLIIGWISTTSATIPTAPNSGGEALWAGNVTGNGNSTHPGPMRLSLSATTTVYLSTYVTFTTSTNSAYGIIRARRVR